MTERLAKAPSLPVWQLSDRRTSSENFRPHDEAEQVRAARFRREEDRLDFLHARALARDLVAGLQGIAALAVRLRSFDDEPPEAVGRPGLSLSWSRSGPFAAAAASAEGRVGIDIERLVNRDFAAMLGMIANEEETRIMKSLLGAADGKAAFYRFWTAKEAILKWRGSGLRGGARSVTLPAEWLEGRSLDIQLQDRDGPVRICMVATGPDAACTLAFSGKRPT